jgi:hypothetical protein
MKTKHFRKILPLIIVLFLFSVLTITRIILITNPGIDDNNIRIWAMFYNVIALVGAFSGLYLSKLWGGYRSIIGRASLVFALGLLAQSFGQNVYNYLYFTQGFNIQPPYPGLGDVGFFGSVLFYIYGVILLAKASGVRVSLKSFSSQVIAFIIPLVLLASSYFIFLKDYTFDWSDKLKIFLDFGYPLGQAFYVSIAILTLLLSRNLLGGLMKKPILLFLLALIAQYFSDFTFLYQANQGTFVVGGLVDCMYFVSYFIMTISLIKLGSTFEQIRNS